MTHISPVKQRIQITFGKFGALKYTSNLDTAKTWERVLRRANLPILYSKGFNTRPRLQLASALPLGITSECEILDVALKEPISLDGVIEQLSSVSPEGLRIYSVAEVATNSPALQTLVRSAVYRIRFKDEIELAMLQQRIDGILSAETLIIQLEKKGRQSSRDMRPLIHDLRIDEVGDLIAHLAVGDYGNIRPEDLLGLMDLADRHYNAHRLQLHLELAP